MLGQYLAGGNGAIIELLRTISASQHAMVVMYPVLNGIAVQYTRVHCLRCELLHLFNILHQVDVVKYDIASFDIHGIVHARLHNVPI